MSFKPVIIWCAKAFLAFCIAFAVLNGFCFLYYNIPVHCIDETNVTDYKWQSDKFYSRGTEGFALGKTNNEGYLNNFDYTTDMEINTLIMGSSHMEAYQVGMNESTAGRLNDMMKDKIIYNIGISAHNFLICCCNFEAALEKYHPSEYLIIETSGVEFSENDLLSAADGTFPGVEYTAKHNNINGFLIGIPFLRCARTQLNGLLKKSASNDADDISQTSETVTEYGSDEYKKCLSALLNKISDRCSDYGVRAVIMYHPTTKITQDGSLLFPDNGDAKKAFADECSESGIVFLDMTERFAEEYETNHILPHGFINSPVGSGHLNKNGHKMIAEELYNIVNWGG